MEKTNNMYTKKEWDENVKNLADKMIGDRITELETFKTNIINNKEKKDEE
jgi:hypothetical protein